ncbi:deoxyribose-phosphate aldolase [Gracilibacillus halotolerans]|uniref:Deoxyribose-phosphate aldolase n=1 Tax=Gracilibacillus halotolerans TaxID=74386 RepID=A0A841RGR6_9BACI|nr:deoxyribose-phosphate aldolase [Gracilibacillus halotolerans]MBB6511831.1 deoxyribose-phosphate aldolase [Gracilibacillus halotolerans]
MNTQEIAKMIDHTLLKPETTKSQIDQLLKEAKEYRFASVCINPSWVKYASEQLQGTEVKVCTVIGFPLGATTTEAKVFEAKQAIENGANEIDMVIAIGQLKSGNTDYVKNDIEQVKKAAGKDIIVKVIIETTLLTNEEKEIACKLSQEAGADFVKTSTGFAGGGATVEDVQLMHRVVGSDLQIKASGGVRNLDDALQMIEAGASRLGASAGVDILNGLESKTDY